MDFMFPFPKLARKALMKRLCSAVKDVKVYIESELAKGRSGHFRSLVGYFLCPFLCTKDTRIPVLTIRHRLQPLLLLPVDRGNLQTLS